MLINEAFVPLSPVSKHSTGNVLAFGATGRLGRAVVAALLDADFTVTASVRDPSYVAPEGVRVAAGDAMDAAAVKAALDGQNFVVNAIGAGTLRKNTIESDTSKIILRFLRDSTVRRYIGISAGMVDTRVLPLGLLPRTIFRIIFVTLFRNIRREHRAVEKLIAGTDLEWTIVRPPRLTNSPSSREYRLSTVTIIPGAMSVPCAAVARFIAVELHTREYVHKVVFIG